MYGEDEGDDFSTMGDLMGDFQTVGYYPVGAAPTAMFRRPGVKPKLVAAPHAMVQLGRPGAPRPAMFPPKPGWRGMVAPGVGSPGEGMQPLPLSPSANNGVFNATNTNITFTARPQVPFRAERILCQVARTGASATGIIINCTSFFVGRQLQLVQNGQFSIEFYSPTAFGVRLSLDSAEPGMDIVMNCVASGTPAGTDTLAVSILLHGRSIR